VTLGFFTLHQIGILEAGAVFAVLFLVAVAGLIALDRRYR
jgi:hypothetical protein